MVHVYQATFREESTAQAEERRREEAMAHLERILIVGGGIAGLTLAMALHQQGFRAELVERSPTWHTTGAGILLHANGMRILQALGLGEAVEQVGVVVRRWGFFDQQGELLCDTDLEALWGEVGPCIGITRPKLQHALLAGAAAVPCRLDTAVTSLTQDEQRVWVGFSDGSRVDYDLVVGADGISSTVRGLTLGSVSPGYTGVMIWRSLAPTRPRGVTNLMVLLGEDCFFGLMPMGDGHTYGFGGVGEPRFPDPPKRRLERVRKRFAGFGGPVPEYLASLSCDEQLHCGPIEWMELDRWYSGRVVLIGDAAHAGPPMMAQGGCMAMEDALVLAEVLCEAETVESALDTYVTRRRPRADWVQQHSRAVGESFLLPPATRNAAFRERGNQGMYDRFGPLVPGP
jgi:2-polyprenyl-6-methoxyphenol hydroxylase-like FAD-dependent oxidoreductase